MDDDIQHEKARLRRSAREARQAMIGDARAAAAHALAVRALELPEVASARSALLYGAAPEEADPGELERALREAGVRIAYPRVSGPASLELHWVDDPSTLVRGSFGLLEPLAAAPLADAREIDVAIVPGVAFDAAGGRLGFGGGYYDALLAGACNLTTTVGIAYDEQVVACVPRSEQDCAVDVLVTPTRTVRCATNRP